MIKKIIKKFSGKGLGGNPLIRCASRIFIFVCNPFLIEGSKMFLPVDEIQFFTGYEREKAKLFKGIVRENDVILDIGAHVGFYAMLAAKLVGAGGWVYAFEPDKENFSLLSKNKAANKYNNIILEKKAVGDKNEKVKLYLWGESRYHRLYGSEDQLDKEVESVSLDNYFEGRSEKISLVKINVVGSEGMVIRGMTGLLKKNPDIKLIIQYSPKRISEMGDTPIDGLRILRNLGFRTWLIKENLELVSRVEDLIKDNTTKELFCERM